ncbi:STAS domain-containing protein [Cyanobacteria bacterium FACHB-DQ100]|uniref:STAS domain-containing protein n=1 Tax=Leptolyngbya sp. DQ-M1 TaxID=2933920 RepID=UPI0019AC6265|nr:STAS domain-containing protein [Cyanobacteria bacterium FACHB-DQ100]
MTLIEQHEVIVLRPQGQLDTAGGEALQQQWTTLVCRRYKLWVVDLSSIEFIDSAGLVTLVAGWKTAAQSDATLVFCGLRPATRLIFEITQLDRVFAIYENDEAILRSIVQPQAVLQAA